MKKNIYIVQQTQPDESFISVAIAAYDNKADAVSLARALNKEYGIYCSFSKDGDFLDFDDWDLCHYYTVKEMEINPSTKKFL